MIAILDPNAAERLAKLCGLFGSEHDGERASAAAMADKLLRSHGLTWEQVISVRSLETTKQSIDFCLDHGADVITAWEWGFLAGIRDWPGSLTAKQRRKLEQLFARVQGMRCAA